MSKIALGGDHAGFEYKTAIIDYLNANGHATKDFGPYSLASVDYPDFVHPVANGVEVGDFDFGILICGSANGVAMTANKHQGIRAGIAWGKELAELTGLTPESVIRILSKFKNDKLIHMEGKMIHILDMTKLKQISDYG